MIDSTARTQAVSALCPDCGEKVRLEGRVYIGREVVCHECDAVLEVVDTEPVELDWAGYDDDEDEDEYDD